MQGWLNEMTMSISAAQPAEMQIAFKGYAGTLGMRVAAMGWLRLVGSLE